MNNKIDITRHEQSLAEANSQLVFPSSTLDWWRGAVIYQVYPRSFLDTNGDGIGDIQGVVQRLDYIESLGVDAIWLSPFFESPMKDFGYDISNFRQVDEIFGSLQDFDELVFQCQRRGLKIIIDQVLSHTSDQHDWFQQSRSLKTNEKADWYVWADAKEDGSAPNNWVSIFGGSAWQWDEGRGQYYFHNFLTSQPDLNYHSASLRKKILEELEFWLKRGVDGFRLDAINFCYHCESLQDNPPKPEHERTGRGFSPDNPYAAQYHHYDNTQPENILLLEEIRTLMDRYPGTVTLGEINSDNSLHTLAEYTAGTTRLHMGYNFELLADEFSPQHIRQTVESLESVIADGWPCWAISNHDVTRVVSRWSNEQHVVQFAKMSLTLAASLRGALCVYQGEELGLTQADIPRDQIQDPYGIAFWPDFKGRDGCRTPMPWDANQPNAGFSTATPWLPLADAHLEKDISKQNSDPDSVLNYYRGFLAWRKNQPCLADGDIKIHPAPTDLLLLERSSPNQQLFALFNLSDQQQNWTAPKQLSDLQICGVNASIKQLNDSSVILAPYGFAYLAPCG